MLKRTRPRRRPLAKCVKIVASNMLSTLLPRIEVLFTACRMRSRSVGVRHVRESTVRIHIRLVPPPKARKPSRTKRGQKRERSVPDGQDQQQHGTEEQSVEEADLPSSLISPRPRHASLRGSLTAARHISLPPMLRQQDAVLPNESQPNKLRSGDITDTKTADGVENGEEEAAVEGDSEARFLRASPGAARHAPLPPMLRQHEEEVEEVEKEEAAEKVAAEGDLAAGSLSPKQRWER